MLFSFCFFCVLIFFSLFFLTFVRKCCIIYVKDGDTVSEYVIRDIEKTERITKLIDDLYREMPEIEPDRAVIITEAYKETENEPVIKRRAHAFKKICENIDRKSVV